MSKKNTSNSISLIIPAYHQEKVISAELLRIEQELKHLKYPFEIVVVVDGTDDKTFKNAKKIKSKHIKVYGYPINKGKGYAIRYGMVRSKGNVIGFTDSGMDLNPKGISTVIRKFFKENADIVIGSKRHALSKVNYPINRKIISLLGQLFIRVLFGLNVTDTQVGMKFFRREILENVLPRLLVKRFAFDIEILTVAYYLGYRKIYDAPVEINYNFSSSILSQNLLQVIFDTFIDTLAIYYRLTILKYYDTGNKRKWRYDPDLDFNINIG